MPNSSMQTKVARLRLHKAMKDEFAFVPLKMRLCRAEPFVLADTMLAVNIEEASFAAYAAQNLTGFADPVSLGVVSTIRTDQPTFFNASMASTTVIGWYVTDLDGKVWFAFKYSEPVVIPSGSELSIPFVHQYRTW